MFSEKFLTRAGNNWLTFGLGLPITLFGAFALSSTAITDFWGFMGMFALGAVYWTVVEYHSAKRFAWERKSSDDPTPIKLAGSHPLTIIFVAYNVVYWLPIVLPFVSVIDFRAGFIAFFGIILFRAIANLIRNNFLTLEQAEIYPFRIP